MEAGAYRLMPAATPEELDREREKRGLPPYHGRVRRAPLPEPVVVHFEGREEVTVREIASAVGRDPSTVSRAIRCGELPATKRVRPVGGFWRWMVRAEDAEAWVALRTRGG